MAPQDGKRYSINVRGFLCVLRRRLFGELPSHGGAAVRSAPLIDRSSVSAAMNLLPPFSLSLDDFVAGLAAAPFFRPWSDRTIFALAFGLYDMAASALGMAVGLPKFIGKFGGGVAIGITSIYGVACLIATSVTRVHLGPRLKLAWLLFISFDNLAVGDLQFRAWRAAVDYRPCERLAALAGLIPGGWLHHFGYRKRQLTAGTAMIAAGIVVTVF